MINSSGLLTSSHIRQRITTNVPMFLLKIEDSYRICDIWAFSSDLCLLIVDMYDADFITRIANGETLEEDCHKLNLCHLE